MSLAEISFSLTKSLMNPWDLFLLSLLFGNIIIPFIDEYIILTYNYYMFKDNRLQIFGAFICFFSVIYAISYYDIYKGIQACNLCILDRYIFVAIGIIFSLSIWAKKLLFLPLIIVSFLLSCLVSSFQHAIFGFKKHLKITKIMILQMNAVLIFIIYLRDFHLVVHLKVYFPVEHLVQKLFGVFLV